MTEDQVFSIYRQSGVIPYRKTSEGIKVLVVSNRKGERWVIPKGIVESDMSPGDSALAEAWEEAGLKGCISGEALGSYRYKKWGGVCTVDVFAMEVKTVAEIWPEMSFRERRWVSFREASSMVREAELRELIGMLAKLIASP